MNAVSNILSVNPSQKTLGAMNPELGFRVALRYIREDGESARIKRIVRRFFVVNTSWSKTTERIVAVMRIMFAAVLIYAGVFVYGNTNVMASTGIILGGTMLAFGMMTRQAMAICGFMSFILGFLGMEAGNIDAWAWTLGTGCLVFSIIGAGRISADSVLRLKVFRFFNRRHINLRRRDRELTYKAMKEARKG